MVLRRLYRLGCVAGSGALVFYSGWRLTWFTPVRGVAFDSKLCPRDLVGLRPNINGHAASLPGHCGGLSGHTAACQLSSPPGWTFSWTQRCLATRTELIFSSAAFETSLVVAFHPVQLNCLLVDSILPLPLPSYWLFLDSVLG